MRKCNINFHIESQGHVLPEYQVGIVDDKTVTLYIPSEAGENCLRKAPPPRTTSTPQRYHCLARIVDVARVVHERSKKLGAHCVSFGKPRAATERELATVSRLANPDEPYYARFIFRYRPEDLLRAQDIISSDAPAAWHSEQSTSGRKRPIDRSRSDTPEEAGPSRKRVKIEERALVGEEEDADALEVELKSIHARARAIEEKLRARAGVAQLKHEPESSNVMIDETRERVDREGSLTRLHTSGGVIDLTLD